MPRVAVTAVAMFALGLDPSSLGEFDLFKYAITQGGLVIVVLVLLWSYRKTLEDQRARAEAAALQERNRKDERIQVLTDLVASNTQAMTRAAAASEANEKAAHRLSKALDDYEDRERR